MAEAFLGEIRLFPFRYAPNGWAQCNGQLLQVRQYNALFALLGTAYGGDGQSTFALPDLRGRVPMQANQTFKRGANGGEAAHVLTVDEIPSHVHAIGASTAAATTPAAVGGVWCNTGTISAYAKTGTTSLSSSALATTGASQAHPNLQPYLVLNFCIATQGIWPPRD